MRYPASSDETSKIPLFFGELLAIWPFCRTYLQFLLNFSFFECLGHPSGQLVSSHVPIFNCCGPTCSPIPRRPLASEKKETEIYDAGVRLREQANVGMQPTGGRGVASERTLAVGGRGSHWRVLAARTGCGGRGRAGGKQRAADGRR